jgi:hypothetical protein
MIGGQRDPVWEPEKHLVLARSPTDVASLISHIGPYQRDV